MSLGHAEVWKGHWVSSSDRVAECPLGFLTNVPVFIAPSCLFQELREIKILANFNVGTCFHSDAIVLSSCVHLFSPQVEENVLNFRPFVYSSFSSDCIHLLPFMKASVRKILYLHLLSFLNVTF